MDEGIQEIKNKTISGIFWKMGERVLAQLISFIVSIVLARILLPEEYGIVALITVFITVANSFVTNGMGTSLIQKKDSDELDFSTMFYTGLALSIVLYIILFIMAPIIAQSYSNSNITILIRVMGIRLPIAAVNSIQQAYVSKKMIYKKFFFSTLIGTIVSGILGIIIAVLGFGVWALVIQYLANCIMDTLVLFVTVDWRPKLKFSMERFKKLFSFGFKVMLTGVLGTVFDQFKNLVIGLKYKASDLAFYNKGEQVPSLVYNNINATFESVLFSAIAKIQDNTESVKRVLRKMIKTISYIIMPIMFGLVVTSENFIKILLTDTWLPCVPYLQIVAIQQCFGVISNVHLQSIKAIGRSDILLKLEFIKKPLFLIFIIIGMQFGPLAIVVANFIYGLIANFINARPNKRLIKYSYKEQLWDITPPLIMSLIMVGACYLVQFMKLSAIITLIIQIIVGVIVYIVLSIIFKIEAFYYLIDIIKNIGILDWVKERIACFFGSKLFKVKKNKIVFDNFNGKGYGCNPKYIAEEIIRQKLDCDLVWLVNDLNEEMPKEIRKVKYKSIRSLYELATAKIWIDNVRNSKRVKKKPEQYYIQTWHGAIGLKAIEADVEDQLSKQYVMEAKEDSKNTDLLLTNNRNQEKYMKKYFWYDGEISCLGTPRCDIIYNTPKSVKNKVYDYFYIDHNKKIVLYAPTFRNNNNMDLYKFDYNRCCEELKNKFKNDFVMLIRLHPNIAEYSNKINYNENIKNATSYPDIQELLAVADVIISDYSSVIFETALAYKPSFILAKDFQEYIQRERKLLYNIEDIPFTIATTEKELYKDIQQFSHDKYEERCKKFYNLIGLVKNENSSRDIVNIIKEKMKGN